MLVQLIKSWPEGDTQHRNVLIDVYRELVLANYVAYDGKKGDAARLDLDRDYPARGILPPGFDRTSGRINHSGMILHNVIKHARSEIAGCLGTIFVELRRAGIWDVPTLESEPSISATEENLGSFYEGATRQVTGDIYERDICARQKCIEYYGGRYVRFVGLISIKRTGKLVKILSMFITYGLYPR